MTEEIQEVQEKLFHARVHAKEMEARIERLERQVQLLLKAVAELTRIEEPGLAS